MTTPTQALHAACLAFERATGREIVPSFVKYEDGEAYIRDKRYPISVCNDLAVHDILEARAWRAVREWFARPDSDEGGLWDHHGVKLWGMSEETRYVPDLPTALLAVAAWVESQPKQLATPDDFPHETTRNSPVVAKEKTMNKCTCDNCGSKNAEEVELEIGVFEVSCPDCGAIYEVEE